MGHNKATIDDIEERVEVVVLMLANGKRTGVIKRLIGNRYLVKHRQIMDYLARARARILSRRDEKRNVIQADSLAFYEHVAAGGLKGSTVRDRLIARKRVDELLGLDEPKRVELSGKVDTDSDIRIQMVKAASDPSIQDDARKIAERLAGIDPDRGARLGGSNGET